MGLSISEKTGIGVALLGAFGAFLLPSSANAATPPDGPTWTKPLPPVKDGAVRQALCRAYRDGAQNAAELSALGADSVYPEIAWPPHAEDHDSVKAFWAAVVAEAQQIVAYAPGSEELEIWCAGDEAPMPELVREWVADEPRGGAWYQIRAGDTGAGIARRVLNAVIPGAGQSGQRRLEYLHCVTSGPAWNGPLYASPSFSKNYPAYFGVNGKGLRAAFMPWNADAIDAMVQGRYPPRTITEEGARMQGGRSYGLLWLPPVDPTALDDLGVVTCGHRSWGDGSSSINPPPEILERLRGAP